MYLLLIALGISLAACQQNEATKQENTDIATADTPVAKQNNTETDVTFTDENGKDVSLQSLKGKVVFINFWATWCPPCKAEMPSINKLKESLGSEENIVFLMVDVDGKLKQSKAFMTQNKYKLQVYAPAGAIPTSFLGNSIPTTVILDKDGNQVARMEGSRDYSSQEMINKLQNLIEKE